MESEPSPPPKVKKEKARRSWRQWITAAILPRAFRLGLLAAVAAILFVAGRQPPPADEISLATAKEYFPTAVKFAAGDARLGGQAVLDDKGKPLGLLLTTSPRTDDIIGYSGPSNLLIVLDAQQTIIGVRVLSSGDTPSHAEQVRASGTFWPQFLGADQTTHREKIDGVGGSTLTSFAFAEAIERRLRGTSVSLRFPEPVKLRDIKKLFKAARKFEADTPRLGWYKAFDEEGKHLGYVVRTSPYSDNARGYQGPTESLIAVAANGVSVIDVIIRKSYDTELYVERVSPSDEFRDSLKGRTIDEWAKIDFKTAGIEGVSGATQTSFAVADGVRRRFLADTKVVPKKEPTWNWQPGLLVVIAGGLAMAFTSLKSNRRIRLVWQVVLVVAFLYWLGDLLSIALFVGWSRHGLPWRTAPAVMLLAAVALIMPWVSRRQVYCQQLCPHGAAQGLFAHFKRLHLKISAAWQRRLAIIPALLLGACVVLATFVLRFDLAKIEPFDAWVLGGAAGISATIALVGLFASTIVPYGFCRYGCPTGELLRLVKSGGDHDRIQRRDWLAAALVGCVALGLFGPQLWAKVQPAASEPKIAGEPKFVEIGGKAFGTSWSVKIRGDHQIAPLQEAVTKELERIESSLSHWRQDSATAQFNASETTFETEQPEELLKLVARAQELSRLSNGRYDITVAPLVAAWGYGPPGERPAPSEEELKELRERVGYEKLTVDLAAKTLRKSNPQLQIDLGSILQGYAADQAQKILEQAGVQECLVDVGGELLARGSWRVGIEDPRNPQQMLRVFQLKDSALATSGLYRTKPGADPKVHHLISPQTGKPYVTTTTLCAVLAPTALDADGWGTALLAVGLPDAIALADEQQLGVMLFDQAQGVRMNAAGEKVFGDAK
ncbi:FAD:protein FMN transferase [Anatilimnocola floriformis]|uniref:FAD:protein FMN transferase n=1 Tax=Anatilimnocola floriformis TaxID=2948575 RepID=UPI0020C20076|nr:FAD:protein FMN transferase [Anatilimnocola floriformis]